MTTGDDQPPLRIGHTERTAAMKALDEHLAEGRLSVEEYADRSAAAVNAAVAADLAALFTDLPAPHPDLPGATAIPPPTAAPATQRPPEVVPRARSVLDTWGPRLVPVVPIVAVGLFLLTRQWQFLLLIPVAFALFHTARRGR